MELLKQTNCSLTYWKPKCRSGENGIHGRLKICWAQALEGSSPSFGTEFPLVNDKSNFWVKNKIIIITNRAIV